MREDKQKSSKVAQYETRLNRVVEEMEKYKSELQKTKKNQRDDLIKDGARNNDLLQENRHLTRQIDDLKNCMKKQFKLIDVLKQQKMHLLLFELSYRISDALTASVDILWDLRSTKASSRE